MKTNEMVTIAIVGYRQYRFIYSAIDSILAQTYENIELIISDDGSDSFPKKEIGDYIERNKKKNIQHVVLNQENKNNGTVKHLNKVISLSTGAYFMLLAADDALHDEMVIEKFVQGFANAGENCFVEMAQTAMYDENLEEIEGYYVRPCIRKLLEGETKSKELYLFLLNSACLPSNSTFYKADFFKAFGPYDEGYKLIEDVPTHIRLAREGWEIHYENFIATKHRSGGISHGATEALSKTKLLYIQDWLKLNQTLGKYCKTDFEASNKEINSILVRNKYERKYIEKMLAAHKNKRTFKILLEETHLTITNSAYGFMALNVIAILYTPQIVNFLNTAMQLRNPINDAIFIATLSVTLLLGALWALIGYVGKFLLSLEKL